MKYRHKDNLLILFRIIIMNVTTDQLKTIIKEYEEECVNTSLTPDGDT